MFAFTVFVACSILYASHAARPSVSAVITNNRGESQQNPVNGGQAAYVNFTDSPILIQITCRWSIFANYTLWMKNASGIATPLSAGNRTNQETFKMTKADFRPGQYWCTAWDSYLKLDVSSDSIFLAKPPAMTLRYEEGVGLGEKVTFTCDVKDDLSEFPTITRQYEYRYIGSDGERRNLTPTPGGVWRQNGPELSITNIQLEWARNVSVVCRVEWLKVEGNSSHYSPGGKYHWSQPVKIPALKKPPVTDTMNETGPLYIAAIAVGGAVLLALPTCALLVLIVWLIKKYNIWRTHPEANLEQAQAHVEDGPRETEEDQNRSMMHTL